MSDERVLEHILNPSAPLIGRELCNEIHEDPAPSTPQEKEAKALEVTAVKLAEENNYEESMKAFDAALALAPNMPSLYNNRAQLFRLKGETQKALHDINAAIELSQGVGKTAMQAYTQRAMLHMLHENEEAARVDFEKSAALGGKFAASQASRLNPYAKLCNQMLSKAMEGLQ